MELQQVPKMDGGQRVLKDLQRNKLSWGRIIRLHFPVINSSLFLSLPGWCQHSLLKAEGGGRVWARSQIPRPHDICWPSINHCILYDGGWLWSPTQIKVSKIVLHHVDEKLPISSEFYLQRDWRQEQTCLISSSHKNLNIEAHKFSNSRKKSVPHRQAPNL